MRPTLWARLHGIERAKRKARSEALYAAQKFLICRTAFAEADILCGHGRICPTAKTAGFCSENARWIRD